MTNKLLFLYFLQNISGIASYTFSKPYNVNWVGVFNNINIFENLYKCKEAFNSIPILIFKNQNLNNIDYLNFVSEFDKSDFDKKEIIHPFKQDSNLNHIGICNNLKSSTINFNNLWHMDNLGKFELPNIVTSFYFEECPSSGGETLFANLPNAYSYLSLNLKREINHLVGLYDYKYNKIELNQYCTNGFRRINNIPSTGYYIKMPFIFKPYTDSNVKSILFSPIRFIKFEGYSEEHSWDLVDHIFMEYLNRPNNVVSIKWEPNDLVIFNNRLLLHTSTPTEIYNGENRIYKTIFLNTKSKIQQ